MLDINKLINAETLAPCDAEAYLQDLDSWSEDQAKQMAKEEGLELTDSHMDVICYLRDQYSDCGPAANARTLLKSLESAYQDQGGRKYLYQLFPHGPVTQACKLAGLPTPPGNSNPSFGSVH